VHYHVQLNAMIILQCAFLVFVLVIFSLLWPLHWSMLRPQLRRPPRQNTAP
jgi:hypothetical protein